MNGIEISLDVKTPYRRVGNAHQHSASALEPFALSYQHTVLNESGQVWRKTTAQPGDYYSQVGLTTPLGKRFTVELGLGDVRMRENFVV